MNSKVILLDVDGTIYDQKGHIPESTRKAISLARKNGHIVLLCTGRSLGEISSRLWSVGFDGIIGSAGAYIQYQEKNLFHRPMTEESVHRLIQFFEEENIPFVLENNDAIYGKQTGMAFVDRIFQDHLKVNPDLEKDYLGKNVVVEDPYSVKKVNKVLFFDAPYKIEVMEEKMGGEYNLVPNSVANYGTCSGELSEKGMTKAEGIKHFLSLTNLSKEDTIAFGDGANDHEMVMFAKVGVAMGNAVESLKEVADYVTDDVSKDGIFNAMKRFTLI